MRIISKKKLIEFWSQYADAKSPLIDWYKKVGKANWNHTSDVKRTFQSVDQPIINGRLIAIFNIGGNKYRLIAAIHFDKKRVFVREIMTHTEYDKGKWKDKI